MGNIRRVLLLVSAVGLCVGAIVSPAVGSSPGQEGRVAYTENGRVYVMNPDGSNPTRVSVGDGVLIKRVPWYDGECCLDVYTRSSQPVWMPDGATLAFLHLASDDTFEIRTVDPDGGNLRVLFDDWDASMITWSPDGSQIAYADDEGIWVADANGSSPALIALHSVGLPPVGGTSEVDVIRWSPDGSRLAFIEWARAPLVAGSSFVTVIDVDGANRVFNICNGGPPRSHWIDWSPDSSQIVCDYDDTTSIWIAKSDGSELRPLDEGGFSPAWSPDGTRVLSVRWVAESITMLQAHELTSQLATNIAVVDENTNQLAWQPRQGSFWDDERSVFVDDIEWLANAGITKGCNPPDNDKYCPDSNVTRGQMAAFLVRALNLADRLEDPFVDDDDSVFEADIEKLAAAGITRGCNPAEGNTKFCPDSRVTRGQMAAFLVRAMGYVDDGGGDLFSDDDGSVFEHDIDCLGTAGVTRGCNPADGNTEFCPNGYVTRGQMAAFLHRALGH